MLKNYSLILMIFMFLASCGGKKEEAALKSQGVWGAKSWVTLGFKKMLLPESLGEGGVDISMDQGKSFVDYQNGVRFSYDELYRTSLPYYEKSYPNISQGENSADFILNLAVHLRRSSLYANQVSLVEKIKGKYGNDIRTIIVTGKENSYDKSYAYVYATNNNDYYTYLYQFVCLEENLKFYYQEIVNCLASTK